VEIEEKIYYENKAIKVTNFRLKFGHDTVPIPKISLVDIEFGAIPLFIAIIMCIMSFASLFFIGIHAILLISISVIIARWCWESYVKLYVIVYDVKIKVTSSSISGRERQFIYDIADALSDAIADSEKQKEYMGFDLTETVQVKNLLSLIEKQEFNAKTKENI
jgi:uncharacterized membrane protein YfbV (UPF0208 family)